MRTIKHALLGLVVLGALSATTANAGLLASIERALEGGFAAVFSASEFDTLELFFVDVGNDEEARFSTPIASLPAILSVTAADGADFVTAAAVVTNSSANLIGWFLSGTSVGIGTGGEEFDPDLAGATIDEFRLTVSSITTNSPGSDPNGDGIWTDVDIATQFQVFGTAATDVPEPSTLVVLSGSALGLAVLRRRRRALLLAAGFPMTGCFRRLMRKA